IPARSTALRYDPKWYAAAETNDCFFRARALYDRSAPDRCSFFNAATTCCLSQTMVSVETLLSVMQTLNKQNRDGIFLGPLFDPHSPLCCAGAIREVRLEGVDGFLVEKPGRQRDQNRQQQCEEQIERMVRRR